MQRKDLLCPIGAEKEIGLLMAMLDDVTEEWTEELGPVSDEYVIWQAFPCGHSIGTLILHMADVEAFWLHQVGAGQTRSDEEIERLLSEKTQQYVLQWPTPPLQSLTWFLKQHTIIRNRTRNLVLGINDPEHLAECDNKQFTLRWLLNHVVSHEAYHGGQAVMLALLQQKKYKAQTS